MKQYKYVIYFETSQDDKYFEASVTVHGTHFGFDEKDNLIIFEGEVERIIFKKGIWNRIEVFDVFS